MIEDGVAISLSTIIVILVIFIILVFTGVFSIGCSSPKPTDMSGPIVNTVYDYKPGEKPMAAINDSSADHDSIQKQAGNWTDLWTKNLM
jgi:hypothetical protein